jgi:cytochrome P450
VSQAVRLRGLLAVTGFTEYVRNFIATSPTPPGGMLQALLGARERGLLDDDELLATCTMMLFAGHETTRHIIGNGVLALLRHPDQLRRLRAEPELLSSAVEELLRYDAPVQFLWRIALEEVELRGKTIRPGQYVRLLVGAANRDPERFPDPDALDIGRRPNRHLSFGVGIHHCLGAGLGRLEAAVAIGGVLRRFPKLVLAAEPELVAGFRLRGPRTLSLLV